MNKNNFQAGPDAKRFPALSCWVWMFLAMACMIFGEAQAHADSYVLGTSAIVVGPGATTNSVVLGVTPSAAAWTATVDSAWLHLDAANQSGIGSTNVIFSCDTNSGATRTGTLAISNQTLSVTQAGSTYVAAQPQIIIFSEEAGPPQYQNIAVDGDGNVYVAEYAS